MEAILGLTAGDADVDEAGATEWFERFFDFFPYEGPAVRDVSAINDEEWAALSPLLSAMQTAFRETSSNVSEKELKAGGWRMRIAPIAVKTLSVFLARGRFSEDFEEQAPSTPVSWP